MIPPGIRKVVVVGQDAAAWLSANVLLSAFGRTGLAVEVVELPSPLRPHDVYMSRPALEAFHRLLGFEENRVLKACSGVFSLGESLANFSSNQPAFLHPYGNHGTALGQLPFHQLWIRAREAGMKVAFEDFSLTAAAARHSRFFVAGTRHMGLGRNDYAYNLKAQAYVQFLKAQALRRGAAVVAARHFDAVLDPAGSHIVALALGDGRRIEGDLFIDATGASARLLNSLAGSDRQDWSPGFPGDRVLTASAERLKQLPSYAQVRALEAGCLYFAPLQDMTVLSYVYDSRATTDDQALKDVGLVAGLPLTGQATLSPLAPGRQTAFWARNCIAIGEAACVCDPIDNPELHMIQMGLAHLVNLFPLDEGGAIERAEYNRVMGLSVDRFRDFQAAHYKLNRLFDRPVWDHLRAAPVSDALAAKIELFSARGNVVQSDEETFTQDDWLSIFIGHGLVPRSHDPRADLVPPDEAIRHVQQVLGFIKSEVENMTSHDAYIEMFADRSFA